MSYLKISPTVIAIGGLLIVALLFLWHTFTPGRYDQFAACLKDRGATFYGAFWCPHCQEQKQIFGKSAKKLPYVECSAPNGKDQLEVCKEAGVTGYPTWKFESDSSTQGGLMTPEALALKTGCELPL